MHNQVKTKLEQILNLGKTNLLKKENVSSQTFTVGLRNFRYHFRKSDLYFYDDAFVIVGFYKIFKIKVYSCIILISNTEQFDSNKGLKNILVKNLKNFNLRSSNNSVYIEFGEASFASTNISVRLKNLSENEKQAINF